MVPVQPLHVDHSGFLFSGPVSIPVHSICNLWQSSNRPIFFIQALHFSPIGVILLHFQTHQSSSPLQAATTAAFESKGTQHNLTSYNSPIKILYTMWAFHFVTNFDSCMHLFLCQHVQNVHDFHQTQTQSIHTAAAAW